MMSRMAPEANPREQPGYQLVDAGDGRRLERFGERLVDRPAPTAVDRRLAPDEWPRADLRFDAGARWTGSVEPWTIEVHGLILELRATASGGVGFYPEHAANVEWLVAQVRGRGRNRQPLVLNLFAHTGLASLAAAQAGAAVAHVDASRAAVAWSRRNADLSGLTNRRIRWLVDDAAAFVAREARRGRRYDGIVLDPPSFGRAAGRRWRLADELPALLGACREIATDDAFVLLTAHTTGLDGSDIREQLATAFRAGTKRLSVEVAALELEATSGARLELGWAARLAR
jgi:23S rRNA (cytosine1962-C5)-methyltransferase